MTQNAERAIELHDYEPDVDTFGKEVAEGLRQSPKLLPCKYLYDERGSQLFDEICELDEYYPTRTELAIMREYAQTMADEIGDGCLLIEYGSGSSIKIRLLLEHLNDLAGYVPVDISRDHLMRCAEQLAEEYPHIEILPVCADYTQSISLPKTSKPVKRNAAYFPGSTIGNFHRPQAQAFLKRIARVIGAGGGLLIGVDLKKDVATLEAAYNDRAGVTAEFNFNLLRRLQRELDAQLDLNGFDFRAVWNEAESRIESHLVSRKPQSITINGDRFHLARGERIRTECSYKYTLEDFAALAKAAGFDVESVWTDADQLFSVQYLVVRS